MKILLCLFLALTGWTVQAKETVTIVYAFSPADTMANYSRTLAAEANRIQNKYTFVFDTKPGAGNSVATNFVRNNSNTILATSSAFFIRPIFFPNESYNVENFKSLMPQCEAPMGIASLKYKSWKEVPTDRPVTIGVSGLGVTTHLVALQIAAKYPNIKVIPFKSTNDSIIAAAGGQIDMTVGFINDLMRFATPDVSADRRLTVLGVTGSKTIKNIEPLIKQGFSITLASMNAPHHLVVPITVSDSKFAEWRDILTRAARAKSVQDSYEVDHAVPLDTMSNDNIQPWFYKQDTQWKRLSTGVKLEK